MKVERWSGRVDGLAGGTCAQGGRVPGSDVKEKGYGGNNTTSGNAIRRKHGGRDLTDTVQ